jgi:acetyltransferase
LGTELVRRLIEVARQEKISKLTGDVLQDNVIMRRVCEKLGFKFSGEPDDPVLKAELVL